MAAQLVDLVKINVTSSGTGALTLGSPATGFRGVEALTNGNVYSYSIQQDANWEIGRGTYLSATRQLIRSPLYSSTGGTAIAVKTNALVAFVPLAEDLNAVNLTNDVLAAAADILGVQADVDAQAAAVAINAALVQAAAINLVYGQAVYPNAYASALPKGVTALSNAGIGTGSGGTPGTYAGGVSGGPAGFAWSYTIGSDGKIASYTITNPGRATGTTAPTLSYPSGSLTGATVPVATVATIVADQQVYWAVSADGSQLLMYGNNGGTLASFPFGGTQTTIYTKPGMDAALAAGAAGMPIALAGTGTVKIDINALSITVSGTVYVVRSDAAALALSAGSTAFTLPSGTSSVFTVYVNTATGALGVANNVALPTPGSGRNAPIAVVQNQQLFPLLSSGEDTVLELWRTDGTVCRDAVPRTLSGVAVLGSANAFTINLSSGQVVVSSTCTVPWPRASAGYLSIAAQTVAITSFSAANNLQLIYVRPDPANPTSNLLVGGRQGGQIPSDAVAVGFTFNQKFYPAAGVTNAGAIRVLDSTGATVDFGFSNGPSAPKAFGLISTANTLTIDRLAGTISNSGTVYFFTEDGLKQINSGQSITFPTPQGSAMILQVSLAGVMTLATTLTGGNYPVAALFANAATADDCQAVAPYGNLLFKDANGITKPILAVPSALAPTFVAAETRMILPDHMYFISGQSMPIYGDSIVAAPAEAMYGQIRLALVTNKSGDRRPFRHFDGDILVDPADLGSPFKIGFSHRQSPTKRHVQSITPHVAPVGSLSGASPKILWIADSIGEYGMLPALDSALVAQGATPTYKGTFATASTTEGTGNRGSEARHSWSFRTFVGRDNISDGPTNITIPSAGSTTTWSQNPFLRVATGTDITNTPDRCFNWDANSYNRPTYAEETAASAAHGTNYVIFDFANYVANFLGGVAPTHIVIALSENDWLKQSGGGYTNAQVIAEMEKALGIMVDSIMAYSTAIKIAVIPSAARGINVTMPGSSNVWLDKYVPGFEHIQTKARALAATYSTATINNLGVYAHTSRIWAFSTTATADLSSYNKQQEETPGDGIHFTTSAAPGTIGKSMYADVVVAWLACKQAGV